MNKEIDGNDTCLLDKNRNVVKMSTHESVNCGYKNLHRHLFKMLLSYLTELYI